MAIVKMRRLRLLTPSRSKTELFKDLGNYGCVEIENGEKILYGDNSWNGLLTPSQDKPSSLGQELNEVTGALGALMRYAPWKKPLFQPKPEIFEKQLYDSDRKEEALKAAQEINNYSKQINSLQSEEGRLNSRRLSLLPWEDLNAPLNVTGGKAFYYLLGVCPATIEFSELTQAIADIPESYISLVSTDRNQHYMTLIYHRDAEGVLDALKNKGFSSVSFKDIEGTAKENILATTEKIAEGAKNREELAAKIVALSDKRGILQETFDSLTLENSHEKLLLSQGETKETTYMEGWVPVGSEKEITTFLSQKGCAYELSDPQAEDSPPVMLKNSKLVEPFGAITELYGLPGYSTVIDPNPFVALFFFLFFGMMFSDAAYGIILAVIAMVYLKKAKPTGGTKRFLTVAFWVGVSSVLWGAVFGSWFGDFIPAIVKFVSGKEITMLLVFDPLAEPMKMLMLSLGFGVVHIFVGMGLAFYRLVKQGHLIDAICDIGFWYLIIIGGVLALVGVKIGLYIALAGALGILFTAGRAKPSIFGKITSGLGGLYNVTAYLSDILSYSRLMALGLATGVVATVINTMGMMGGNTVIGWILFIIVFVVGQLFNLAINLLGAFVHTCRLQYVEFFGKFFEGGGRAFAPLNNKTKFVNVVKEDK